MAEAGAWGQGPGQGQGPGARAAGRAKAGPGWSPGARARARAQGPGEEPRPEGQWLGAEARQVPGGQGPGLGYARGASRIYHPRLRAPNPPPNGIPPRPWRTASAESSS